MGYGPLDSLVKQNNFGPSNFNINKKLSFRTAVRNATESQSEICKFKISDISGPPLLDWLR